MAVAREHDLVSEREQVLAAERDNAYAALRAVVRVLTAIGGYLDQEQQNALSRAKALLGVDVVRKDWSDR